MVSVFRGGVGGCALALCLTSLAGLPGPNSDYTHDEQILRAARIGVRPVDVLGFLRSQILEPKLLAHAETLIGQLGHESFRVREAAVAQLIHMGPGVLPLLEQAKKHGDLETRRRAERCAHGILQANRPEIVSAAIRLISAQRPSGTTKVLLDYLPAAANAEIAEQVCDALLTIGLHDASAEKCLEKALSSRWAGQRAAAGFVLAQRGSVQQHRLAKDLLGDSDPTVRLRVAQGLLARADTDAVPSLISLLSEPAPIGPEAEDILLGLAGETAPAVAWANQADRTKAAWHDWWRTHADAVNLADFTAFGRQGPVARAKSTAHQFLAALSRGDFPAFKRAVEIPFHLGGLVTFTAADDFDQLFRQVLEGQEASRKELSFQITGMGSFADFQQNLGQLDLERLKNLDSRKLHVVFVQGRFGSEASERGAILVRLTAARALVIGIYQAKQDQ